MNTAFAPDLMALLGVSDDTTVVADGFPVLNALKEVHLLLTQGAHNQYGDLPWTARQEMLETLSLFDDSLMEALLEERDVPIEQVRTLIREATLSQEVTPVMVGTAYRNKGVQELLDAVTYFLASPLDRTVKATNIDHKKVEGEPADAAKVTLSK